MTTLTSIVLALFSILITASIAFKKIHQNDQKYVLSWIGVGIAIGALLAMVLTILYNGKELPKWELIFAAISASGVFISVIIFPIRI